jgi:hypothetical protein
MLGGTLLLRDILSLSSSSVWLKGGPLYNWPSGSFSSRSLFVAITVLAIDLVGDGLRDTLDPKPARRM